MPLAFACRVFFPSSHSFFQESNHILFLNTFLKRSYRFTTELSRRWDFLFLLCPRTHSFSHCRHHSPKCTFFTKDEPVLTHRDHQVHSLQFTLGGVPSMGVDKCLMTCSHHYNIIQHSYFPKNPFCSAYSSLPTSKPFPNLYSNHWSFYSCFYCLHSCVSSTMSYSWDYTVHRLFRLASSLSNTHLRILYAFSQLYHSFTCSAG